MSGRGKATALQRGSRQHVCASSKLACCATFTTPPPPPAAAAVAAPPTTQAAVPAADTMSQCMYWTCHHHQAHVLPTTPCCNRLCPGTIISGQLSQRSATPARNAVVPCKAYPRHYHDGEEWLPGRGQMAYSNAPQGMHNAAHTYPMVLT